MNTVQDNLKFALITPSYAPDFERCKLLTESVEYCLTDDTKHYIVVDRRDVPLFKQLTSPKIHLLVVEELLPSWIFRVPGIQKWWMSFRTLPIRNWILQQLVKMSVFDAIDENVVVFCDSDNTFIRKFDMKSCLVKDDRLAFLRVDYQDKAVYEWIESTRKILGIPDKVISPVTYVSNMIAWHRNNVLAMRHHIEDVNGIHWIRAICQHRSISEYMIYGIFVEHVVGIEKANHSLFDTELIKPSWSHRLNNEAEVKDFFDHLEKNHIGVMIHSKDKVPLDIYRDKVRTFWQFRD
jgi:Family of unknown function (DUF6492)